MRHVFKNGLECLHVFASQTQDYGSAGNISFRDQIAYSYGRYPIARIINTGTKRFGTGRALIQSDKYSMTTARHISDARSALSHFEQITVPNLSSYSELRHWDNISYFMRQYAAAIDKGKRSLKFNLYNIAHAALETAKRYCLWFPGCKKDLSTAQRNFVNRTFKKIDTLIINKELEISERELRLDSPEHKARVLRDTERRYGKQLAELQALVAGAADKAAEQLALWQDHKADYASYNIPVRDFPMVVLKAAGLVESWHNRKPYNINVNPSKYAYLRFNADHTRIETSKNAQVLVEHAKAIWPLIERSHREQAVYPGNGHKIDYYTVTEINKGDLVIGCHNIQYAEMEAIAKTLNLI